MADIQFAVQVAFNCLVLSALFLIVATGLNIIYGINRVINLAHGSLYALGAYLGYTLVSVGLNFFLVLVIVPVIGVMVGVIIERSVISPVRGRQMTYTLILTYGLSVFLDGLMKYVWGTTPHFIDAPAFISQTITIAGVPYPFYRLFIIIATVVVMGGLMFLMERTKLGITMRAASTIPEMVSALGINMNFVFMFVFALGCMLAAVAGVIAGPLLTVHPFMGSEMLISCFVILVVGGLGSLRGSALAALLIGTVQTLGFIFVTDYAMVVVYLAMAVVLIFSPRGLLREGKFE